MKGQHVLITGGTGGLGLGVVPLALDRGAAVTIPYRDKSGVDRLEKTLSPADFSRIRFVPADLTDEAAVADLVGGIERLDALIHLTGGFGMGAVDACSLDAWQGQFTLNLTTAFLACKHCLIKMKAQGYGRIVTIGAKGAREPGANVAAYSAAKAGVVALTQAIAAETKGTNITANAVLPSMIDTPANRADMGDEAAKDWVDPASLAQVICFLASDVAGDLRGAAVPVYGNL